MLQHMAMEQPQAGIVGDKNKSGPTTSRHQPCVAFARRGIGCGVVNQHPKMVTMQMHGMWPRGVIENIKCYNLSKLDIGKCLVVIANDSIERP